VSVKLFYYSIISCLVIGYSFCASDFKKLLHDRVEASFLAAAWGDVLGGVTEFHKTREEIFSYHPDGVSSIADFTPDDWKKFPFSYKKTGTAPYTDDTAMALLVAQTLLNNQNGNNSADILVQIARAFITDMNSQDGFAAGFRAPGNFTMTALHILAKTNQVNWKFQFDNHYGCGSVMRAYPAGLLYWKDLKKAEYYAVLQSKVTHGSPMALASSAALAVGVGFLLSIVEKQNNNGCDISNNHLPLSMLVDRMISIANKYDHLSIFKKDRTTGQKIKDAYDRGLFMQQLFAQNSITDPSSLIRQLKNKDSEVSRYYFQFCKDFPGWRADDAISAAIYVITATIQNPYLGIILGVHSTGDSDSVASIAGSLLGAFYGKELFPQEILKTDIPLIENIASIKKIANQLADCSIR